MYFRGTNVEQDTRFGDKDKKLKAAMKFPACFKTPVLEKSYILYVII